MSNNSERLESQRRQNRRQFLCTTGISAVGAARLSMPLMGQEATAPAARVAGSVPGLIVRQQEPANLEFPFSSLDSITIPQERFYVRNHFPVPQIAAANMTLEIAGHVQRPLRLSFEELVQMPSRTLTATMECAGNNRVSLVPRERGLLWGPGAVGNAEWTGVPLAAVLERAGVRDGAADIVLEGADLGAVNDEPRSPGIIRFARSLPLAKARSPEVLLAYRMNGRDLTPNHGYPLRAVVPGWYGVASVKWLTRIAVIDRPFDGFFQTFDYSIWDRRDGLPAIVPIREMDVKASIARPASYESIAAGVPYRVHGAAWTGEASVTGVEVSTDNGATWSAARLIGQAVPHSWRLWDFTWQNPRPGQQTVMARATDSRGRTQPMQRQPDRRNYMISHVLPISVDVR